MVRAAIDNKSIVPLKHIETLIHINIIDVNKNPKKQISHVHS